MFGSQLQNILKELPISVKFHGYIGIEIPKFGTMMQNEVISGGHFSGGHFSGGNFSVGHFSIGHVSGGHFTDISAVYTSAAAILVCVY